MVCKYLFQEDIYQKCSSGQRQCELRNRIIFHHGYMKDIHKTISSLLNGALTWHIKTSMFQSLSESEATQMQVSTVIVCLL